MIARSLFCLLLFVFSAFAQKPDDAAKIKQQRQTVLIDQILGDIQNLKLGENRAFVYAKVGNLLWQTDEKRARILFQNAVSELINAQILAEADKKSAAYQYDLLTGQNTRPQILNIIASRDAELALEYLSKTRPEKLLKALAISPAKNSKISNSENYSYLVQNETNLEQNFIRLAADQNPQRALKLLKESLKKGVSNETLNLLKKLHEKDAESADEFASEIVGKLLGVNFSGENQPNYQNLNVAVALLNEFIRERNPNEKFLKFDGSQMKSLADKLISFYLQQSERYGYSNHSILPIAEKLSPANVEQLKLKQTDNPRHGFHSDYDPEIGKLLSGEATAEQLLGEAKKFPKNSRRQIYQATANKFAQQGDMSRAKEVLADTFSDDALEEANRNLDWQYTYNLISNGKFAEAERMIDEFPENTRLGALVNLANAIYQNNPADNKSYAMAVLGKARALMAEKPEDSSEMAELVQIISAFATIEAAEAFRLLESLVPQINELSEAAVITYGFQRGSNVRSGEFLLTTGYPANSYINDYSILAKLAKSDFDRLTNLIDGFSRRESRIALKLQLTEGILN